MATSKGILILAFILTSGFSSSFQLGKVEDLPEVRTLELQSATLESFSELSQKLLEIYPGLKDNTYTVAWKDAVCDDITFSSDIELKAALQIAKVDKPSELHVYCKEVPEDLNLGFRYKCGVSTDYDLCSKCEAADHYMNPVPNANVPSPSRCSTPEGRLRWVQMRSGNMQPPDALEAGFERQYSYVARAYHNNMLIPGKYVPSNRFAFVTLNGQEHRKETFEILVGYEARWITTQGNQIPSNALVGGSENNEYTYVCRAIHDGTLIPGKVSFRFGFCYVPSYNREFGYRSYQILVVP